MINNINKNSYYYKYKRQAYIFEGIGIVGIVLSILVNELTGRQFKPIIIIVAAIAMFFLIIGGASSRPHVLVKSFATLLANEPTTQNAKEFIYALDRSGTVHLVKSSQALINSAIMSYENSSEANSEITQQLREAVKTHIKRKII
jgi:hypothetical protein